MSQPPSAPILAHENTRNIPSLSQKTLQSASAGAGEFFGWEFDLALGITDASQFITNAAAPIGGGTIAGGGPGPQTTPQAAVGPWADVVVFTSGAGGGILLIQYAADASPCTYQNIFLNNIPGAQITNASGLRVTGRFVRFLFQNLTAASVVECGFYIRSWT